MQFIKKLRVCDVDGISQEELITYKSLVQQGTHEYRDLVDSKRWEPSNNGQGAWGFHWNYGHEEWKNKQGKKSYVHFSYTTTNAVIYCSYLMTTREDSMEEEAKGGDDSQSNGFISLNRFELLE